MSGTISSALLAGVAIWGQRLVRCAAAQSAVIDFLLTVAALVLAKHGGRGNLLAQLSAAGQFAYVAFVVLPLGLSLQSE